MTDLIHVPFDNPAEQAVLLLAAAQELDFEPGVVRTTEGAFLVPPEVKDKAFAESKPPPHKKAAAKSTTPKKAQE